LGNACHAPAADNGVAETPTRLKNFRVTQEAIDQLGYAVCDAGMRRMSRHGGRAANFPLSGSAVG